jgi:predicted nucleotidyltransferase component of viral defense system
LIPVAELKRLASDTGIHFSTLELDYCLGWMLYGISREHELYHGIIFKGGTALRKCYFKEYRFSQDLDYTCRKELPPDRLEPLIRSACRNASHMSGIGFELVEFKKLREVSGEEAFNARIEYRGPSNPSSGLPRIQFDLTYYEDVVLPPEDRKILHFYTDSLRGARAWSYCLDEVLAEKMRSILQQRTRVPRPRDFYDLWWVLKNKDCDRKAVRQAFSRKCELKKVPFKTVADFFGRDILARNAAAWKASIGRQVKDVPSFEIVVKELRAGLERLLL